MNVSIFEKHHFRTSLWSGGSTTQLYISPADTSYADRNFNIRISSAKVEVENSTFTSLPDVNRKLMILEGEITITHRDEYSKHLKPFDVDTFSGDWHTTAIGTCTDFNVMTTGSIKSELYSLPLAANSSTNMNLNEQWKTLYLYLFSGDLHLEIDQNDYHIKKGNLLVAIDVNNSLFSLRAIDNCQVVVVKTS
ncbi:MAG: HutD family protein [Bacteroidetes bacterium]|nr:HutD family protein [Bacteroidota bacterium]